MRGRTRPRTRQLKRVGIALAAYLPDLELLQAQLKSIRDQDHNNWFCVIAFDSPIPTDREAPWLREMVADSRFKVLLNQVRIGPQKNFEVAVRTAHELGAEAICLSDQDDLWYPNKVSRSLELLNGEAPLSAILVDARVIICESNQRRVAPLPRSHYQDPAPLEHRFLLHLWSAWGNGLMFDAELFSRHPYFPVHINHDDWIGYVASRYGGLHFIPEPLFDYLLHGNNLVGVAKIRNNDNPVSEAHRLETTSSVGLDQARIKTKILGTESRRWRLAIGSSTVGMALLAFLILEAKVRGLPQSKVRKLQHLLRQELVRSSPSVLVSTFRRARALIRRRSAPSRRC